MLNLQAVVQVPLLKTLGLETHEYQPLQDQVAALLQFPLEQLIPAITAAR